MYIEKSVKEYMADLSAKKSVPGGGSASSLVMGLASALGQMYLNFSLETEDYYKLDDTSKHRLISNLYYMDKLGERLEVLVDEDTQAFNSAMEAFKLGKSTEEERLYRLDMIQKGYKEALMPPLESFRIGLELLRLQKEVAEDGNKNLITDLAIGGIFAYGAMEASAYNIKINLSAIKDQNFKKDILEEIDQSLEEAREYKDIILGVTDTYI